MIDSYDIIHAPNWGALCVAICYKFPVSPETAALLYERGRVGCQGVRGQGKKTVSMLLYLRTLGMTWSKISAVTGLKSPGSIVAHWEKRKAWKEQRRWLREQSHTHGEAGPRS